MGEVANGRVCVVGLGVGKVVGWGKWQMGGCVWLDWVYGRWWDGEVSNGRVCVVGLGVRKVVGWGSVKWEGVCGRTGRTEGDGMGECQMGGGVWLDWVYGRWWDGEVSNGRVCVVGLGVRKVVGWGSVKWEGACGWTGCTEGGGMGKCQMGGCVWLDWVYGRWWDGEVSNGRVCVVGLGVRKVVGWGSVKWEDVCGWTGCREGGGMGEVANGRVCVVGLGVGKVVGWGKWQMGGCVWLDWV